MNVFSLGATWINAIFNTLWLTICRVIYVFINWLYQVFETVANVNLFSEEVFKDITSRIYIVMGIAMLFIFAYNIVLMIINPDDKKSTGSTTKLVKDTIISLIVIVLLPTIFNYMYVFQGHVLSSNIIGKIVMGGMGNTSGDTSNCDPDDYECTCDFSEFEELKNYGTGSDNNLFAEGFSAGTTDVLQSLIDGCNAYKNLTDSQRGAYSIAPTIFSAFYRPKGYDMVECENFLKTGTSNIIQDDTHKQVCANFFYDIKMSKYTGNINPFVSDSYLTLTLSTWDGFIEFDWLFAIVAGGLAVWMFLCYAMEIGVRVAKLGVLQIISPIAVMMRIVPSKGGGENQMYSKWFEELKNTYLDVFIRLVIIYFSLFAISLVPDVVTTLFSSLTSSGTNWFIQTLSMVIVILGILKFGQEAPELLKTFFGSSGKFALRSPKKQFNENKLAKGAVGYAGGAALGALSSVKRGKNPIGGFFKGGANAARNLSGADLTKRGAFLNTMRDSKYQTDYEQNNSKFQAIKRAGGLGNYIKEQGKTFSEFISDANNQSEKVGAANALYANSARVNELVVKDVIKGEDAAKAAFETYKDIYLGNNYYKRNAEDGNWYDKDGKAYSRGAMEQQMKDYYRDAKVDALTEALKNNKKDERDTIQKWTEAFNKSMIENFPKLGDEIGQKIFKTIESEGGIKVNSMEELMNKMDEFQANGQWKEVAKLKFASEKAFKDAKEGTYDFKAEQKKS